MSDEDEMSLDCFLPLVLRVERMKTFLSPAVTFDV